MAENNEEEDARRKAVEEKCKSIIKKADNGLKLSADMAKGMSEARDAATLGMQAAKYGTPFGEWEIFISSIERLDNDLDEIGSISNQYYAVQPQSSTDTSTAVYSGSTLVMGPASRFASNRDWVMAAKINAEYEQYFERHKLRENVLGEMARLGFEGSTQGRMTIEKFRRGWEMFGMELPNVDMSISTVIPVRAAIKLSIDELIALLPSMPRGYKPKRKIMEIGTRIGADGVPLAVFEELEADYPKHVDVMSGTKDDLFTRERRYELMRLGTLFLKRLFSAIDEKKLRKRRRLPKATRV